MSAPKRERRAPKCHRPKGASRRGELELLAAEADDERNALLLELLAERDEPDQAPHTGGATHEAD